MLDIRTMKSTPETKISFAEPAVDSGDGETAFFISMDEEYVYLNTENSEIPIMYDDLPNLIKALQYVVDEGYPV